jgi:hypothetical protein
LVAPHFVQYLVIGLFPRLFDYGINKPPLREIVLNGCCASLARLAHCAQS